jgi:hypothetical protein
MHFHSAIGWRGVRSGRAQRFKKRISTFTVLCVGSSVGAPVWAQTTESPASESPGAVQSMNPDLSVIGDFAFAVFSEEDNHQTGAHDPLATGFNLQALELSLGAAVDPYFRFDAHLVFSPEGAEIEEAYGTTLDLGARMQARFGQFLTRFGRINATHPHAWDFVDQPFALGRNFGGEGNRGLGLELSYLSPLPWYLELVGSVTPADGEESARSFYGATSPSIDSPLDFLYVTALKQFFPVSDDWSVFWGLSGAFGPNPTSEHNRSEIYGSDLYVKFRPITRASTTELALQTEWFYRRRQVPEDVLADLSGYAQLVYRFSKRFAAGARYEYGTPSYSKSGDVVVDALDPEWTRSRHRVSVDLTHYPTEFSRFRLQGSRDMGLGDPVWAAFLNAELAIGAHAAHPF